MKKIFEKNSALFKKDKWSSEGIFALVFALLLVFNIMLTIIVESFGLYIYEKDSTDYSISGNTDHLFENAIAEGKKIKVSFCLDKFDEEGYIDHETGKLVHRTVMELQERYPGFIELDYINVMTRRNKDGKLVDISKYQTDMRGEETKILKTSVIFECGDNYRVVTDLYSAAGFADFYTLDASGNLTSYNGEEVVASMMSWVLSDTHETAYFTQYHSEVVDIAFANLLVCAGYYIDVLDLKSQDVPSDAAMVVISNPRTDFERGAEGTEIVSEIERLRAYLNRGGNLMVTLDPYVKRLAVLEGFIAEYGIAFSSSVDEKSGRLARNIVKDYSGAITPDGFTLVAEYAKNELASSIDGKVSEYSDGSVIIREVSALELSGNAKPLLVSSSASVLEAHGKTLDTSGGYTIAAYSDVALESGERAKICVVPSIYLAVSDSLVSRGYSNKDFVYALLEKFFESGTAPYGCNDLLYETDTLENLTMRNARIYTAVIMTIPAALAIVGAVIIVKRRQR